MLLNFAISEELPPDTVTNEHSQTNSIILKSLLQYSFSLSDSSIPKLKRLADKIKEDNKASRVPYDVFSYVSK